MFNSRSSASLNNCTETPKVTKIIYADNTQNLDLLFRSAKSRNILIHKFQNINQIIIIIMKVPLICDLIYKTRENIQNKHQQ